MFQKEEEMKMKLASKTKEIKNGETEHGRVINELKEQFKRENKKNRLKQIEKDIASLKLKKENAEKQAHSNLVNYKFKFFVPGLIVLCIWVWITYKYWNNDCLQWLIYIIPLITSVLYWAYTAFFCKNISVKDFFKKKEDEMKLKQYLLFQFSEDEYSALKEEKEQLLNGN